jgi:hypothetical protein
MNVALPSRDRVILQLKAQLLLAVLLAPGNPVHAQRVGLTLGDSARQQLLPGRQITVPLTADLSTRDATTFAALQTEIVWNPARLAFDSARAVAGSGFTLATNAADSASGRVTLNTYGTTALAASGQLLQLYFTARSGSGGTRIAMNVQAAGNEAGQDIRSLLRVREFALCVAPTGRWGNANSDDAVNILEAQQIAR